MAGAGIKLTKRVVDQASGDRGRHYLWDGELRGFGLQVEKSGTKTYFVRYRPKGHGRAGVRRFFKLGRHGDLTPEQAREQAKRVLGAVAAGADPAAELKSQRSTEQLRRQALTVRALADLFLKEHARAKRKPKTAIGYEIVMRCHVNPALGEAAADEVTRSDLAALHLKMGGSTANRMLTVVSSMYSFAAKRGLVPEGFNPARGIEKYREEGRKRASHPTLTWGQAALA